MEEEIRDYLPEHMEGCFVGLQSSLKPNVGEKVGLVVCGNGMEKVAPIIYLEPFYDRYTNGGVEFPAIMMQVATVAARSYELKPNYKVDGFDMARDMPDWEKVKDKVTVRVLGVTGNTELLRSLPCRIHGDIALIYQVSLQKDDNTRFSVRITNTLLDAYGITPEELHDTAIRNTERMSGVKCKPIGEVLEDLLGADPGLETRATSSLYVLTNNDASFGAAAMFYPGVLEKIGKKMPEGFFILPSSIHEVMVFPHNMADKEMLETMVREINATQVEPDEVLSNYVSEYDSRTMTVKWGRNPDLQLPPELMAVAEPQRLDTNVIL